MLLNRNFLLLSLLPTVFAEQLVILQVEAAIKQEQQEFSVYTGYKGPTGALKAEASLPTPKKLLETQSKVAVAAAAAAQPYWYEQITHQGIQAFNTYSGYTVFRNVKTYGAKGCVIHGCKVEDKRANQ